jgi:hypothetical protein
MPSSYWGFIGDVLDEYVKARPKKVLDLGIGFGKWGHLFREYGDIYQGRYDKGDWEVLIDGVEAYQGYIKDHQKYVYSNIYLTDISSFTETMGWYDFVFAGDVIEHLPKRDAIDSLTRLSSRCATLLVSLPLGLLWAQGVVGGNPFESHQSIWNVREMERMGFSLIKKAHVDAIKPIGLFKRRAP